MKRFLLIDADRAAMQKLGLACLERDVAVSMAENLCEGVRILLTASVSLIVVDATRLRLTPGEHATLFERVAPGVPVVVVINPDAELETLVAYEVAGFTVKTRPVAAEDLLDKAAAVELR
jgi:ActR/RegA family two-component response regulator